MEKEQLTTKEFIWVNCPAQFEKEDEWLLIPVDETAILMEKFAKEREGETAEKLQDILDNWDYTDPMSRAIHDLEDFIETLRK